MTADVASIETGYTLNQPRDRNIFVAHRICGESGSYFLVKWEGQGWEFCTWAAEDTLLNASLLEEWKALSDEERLTRWDKAQKMARGGFSLDEFSEVRGACEERKTRGGCEERSDEVTRMLPLRSSLIPF